MRAVIQRVSNALVEVDGNAVSAIGAGLLVLVGFHPDDTQDDKDYIISKIIKLRIFNDKNDKMNLSLADTGGEVLVVSQFTLYGNAHKGNRPSYSGAMPPDDAARFYSSFIDDFRKKIPGVKSGIFGSEMSVTLTNSGPVTILIDSKKIF